MSEQSATAQTEAAGTLLEIEGLNAFYGSAQALEDVSFAMGRESIAIVGRNGMGKTTLCNAIMGISPPRTSGSIRFDGRELVGSLSHGEHRQVAIAMALAAEPKALMLDEPASGLSRGERQLLTDLLLDLDPEITLILIEHDMDIALRVAERVTMMHDGRVIVEGTPAEIRANETVHDLYLGRGYQA